MKRILLVEDDPVLLKLYADLLKTEQLIVETATEGQEAYEKMKVGGWNLVLLDMLLPQMNGLDIVRKLKSSPPQTPNKKIVFLTNLEKGKELDEIKKMGFEFIIKSNLTPDKFVEKIKSYL